MKKNFSKTFSIFLLSVFLFNGFNLVPTKAAISGDLIINEFIPNPTGTDSSKEWIEVKNTSSTKLNLSGWQIFDTSNHAISGDYIIPAGGLATICKNASSTLNGGLTCNYQSNFSLANSGERLFSVIDDLDNIIDSVTYIDSSEGQSYYLSNTTWLINDTNLYNQTDYGTPGIENISIQNIENDILGNLAASVNLSLYDINISPSNLSALFEMKLNATGTIQIDYGQTENYDYQITQTSNTPNTVISQSLENLNCDTLYHYLITANSNNYIATSSGTFITNACTSITIDSISTVNNNATPNNSYDNAWAWNIKLSAFNENENNLQLKFSNWLNQNNVSIDSANNMRFSINNGTTWQNITENDIYSNSVSIENIDIDENTAGRQIEILVQMKLPIGTLTGNYSTNYGIKIE